MKRERLSETTEAYVSNRLTLGRTEGTILHVRRALSALGGFLARRGVETAGEIDREMVRAFLAERYSLALERAYVSGPATYAERYAKQLRPFFRWAVASGRVLVSPMDGLRVARGEVRLPRNALTLEETRRILAAPDTNDILGLRDRAVLEIMYSSGLRRGEVAGLDLGDVDLAERTAMIRNGKGRKDRVVPMGEAAARWMRRYLSESRPLLERDSSERAFFLTTIGARLHRILPHRLIQRSSLAAGIERRVTSHTMRHTCATHMLRGGADIRHVQELLGHEDLRTTQIYTRVAITDLREAHRRFHPRGGMGCAEVG